jgi:uncharacterized membrane protein YfhO
MLILGDFYYPGWQAQVDGRATPVHRVDYALRGVCVSPGRHRVVFTFDPPVVRHGILISKIGLSVVGLAALSVLWEVMRRFRRTEQE